MKNSKKIKNKKTRRRKEWCEESSDQEKFLKNKGFHGRHAVVP